MKEVFNLLVHYGAHSHVNDVVYILNNHCDRYILRCYLQHLKLPCYITDLHLLSDPISINGHRHKISHEFYRLGMEVAAILAAILHLLQHVGTFEQKSKFDSGVEKIFCRDDITQIEKVSHIDCNLQTLKNHCVMTIRHHMTNRTDESFTKLCLPSGLLPLVKLHTLAEELIVLWNGYEHFPAFTYPEDPDDLW